MSLIDDWLPEFDVGKRYDAAVAATPERALDLVLAAPVAPDPVVGALLAVRGLPARGRTVEEYLRALDFDHLGRTPTEWAAAHDGRRLKIAIAFEAEEGLTKVLRSHAQVPLSLSASRARSGS